MAVHTSRRSTRKIAAAKVVQQKVNSKENKAYYQAGTSWKSPSSDRERAERRTMQF